MYSINNNTYLFGGIAKQSDYNPQRVFEIDIQLK